MLKLIFCDHFKEKVIRFHQGLNVVAGDYDGSNSIGKTSLLLVIDFVFGGDTYSRSEDILKNVGHHSICSVFEFEGKDYYFKRSTSNPNNVSCCDDKFSIIKSIDIKEFNSFLFTKYRIGLSFISWREMVSLYYRIYSKDNHDEKAPLHRLTREKSDAPIPRLIKLFNLFAPLAQQNEIVKETSDIYSTYTKAQKLNLVDNRMRSERQIEKATASLERMRSEADLQMGVIVTDSVNLTAEQMTLVYQLRQELSHIQTTRRKLVNRIKELRSNYDQIDANYQIDADIVDYFPDINLKKIEEINAFHKSLSTILKDEISKQIKGLEKRHEALLEQEKSHLSQIDDVIGSGKDAKAMALGNYMNIHREIENLVKGIDAYKTGKKFKDDRDNAIRVYKDMFSDVQSTVTHSINTELEKLNDYIYDGQKKAPRLEIISPTQYNYISPDDTGTGSRYRSLLIFDIAVLKLTQLPSLCHDSLLFKNVATTAVSRILQLYETINNKQIFIALDEIEKLPREDQEKLSDLIVIKLGPNGCELFGKSWNKK